jgi:tripartite-type tricarboxylate transporter receptor subunit TctC
VKSVAELVAKAKAEKMSYASGGAGVPGHLSMELLQSMAGFQMTHIPYKGPAPATQDVLGNQVRAACSPGRRCCRTCAPASSSPSRSRAAAARRRCPTCRRWPRLASPATRPTSRWSLFAPRGVPEPIVARFRQAFVDALNAPDLVDKLKAGDQTVVGSSAARGGGDAAPRLEEVGRGRAADPARLD